jgi:hypothetical protein
MTIEELIACDAATLEKLSDEELRVHFAQYFPETRPEQATPAKRKEQQVLSANPNLAKGLALAKSLGIDMDLSLLTYRKKK